MDRLHRAAAAGLCLLVPLSLATACARPSAARGGALTIVASTDVYGDIARQIGGSHVAVTSLVDSATQDPHSFQANAHDELAVSRADVLVQNGGGYDNFMTTLRASSGGGATAVLDVVRLSGRRAVGGSLNEHVWYDFGAVRAFVVRLTATLSAKDPQHRTAFRGNAAAFTARLRGLERTEAGIARAYRGAGVAVTEPVPLYLLDACGLVNRTPGRFTAAVEEGTGVPVAVLQQTLALFAAHRVRLLVYNAQTAGPETAKVIDAARADRIPVVGVTETLPPGNTYLSWMSGNLAAVGAALAAVGS